MNEHKTSDLGRAVQEVTEKAQLLVREEIELAKAEVSQKVSRLIKGAVVGIVAGIFLVGALIYALHSLSWALWSLIFEDGDASWVWAGYAITAVMLVILGAIAGLIAMRLVKRGSPPTPQMAMHEAQLIRETVTNPHPAALQPVAGSTQVRTDA